jgi:hypothetical protein
MLIDQGKRSISSLNTKCRFIRRGRDPRCLCGLASVLESTPDHVSQVGVGMWSSRSTASAERAGRWFSTADRSEGARGELRLTSHDGRTPSLSVRLAARRCQPSGLRRRSRSEAQRRPSAGTESPARGPRGPWYCTKIVAPSSVRSVTWTSTVPVPSGTRSTQSLADSSSCPRRRSP